MLALIRTFVNVLLSISQARDLVGVELGAGKGALTEVTL